MAEVHPKTVIIEKDGIKDTVNNDGYVKRDDIK